MKSLASLYYLLCLLSVVHSLEDTCTSESSCSACNLEVSLCRDDGIYRHGGSAQAYKPLNKSNHTICGNGSVKHRVASWPYSRSTRKNPPKLILNVYPMSCSEDKEGNCCSVPFEAEEELTIEVWQPRPDGTYSSLSDTEDDDCRGKATLESSGVIQFETYAPGSVGSLGGLGPSKYDFLPYGPPVLHLLARGKDHAPILVDIPMLLDKKKLELKSFGWSDFRGVSWIKPKAKEQPYSIANFKADPKKNQVSLDIILYIPRSTTENSASMCQSYLPLFPASFFLEPISQCSPFLLDYFNL